MKYVYVVSESDCLQYGQVLEINSKLFKELSLKIDNGTLKS